MHLNATHEEEYKPLEGQEVFRVQRVALVIGLIGLAVSIGVGIIAFFDRDQTVSILILSVVFAFMSILTITSYLVTRLYMDAEGIEHRNSMGIRKRIGWKDVEAVYAENSGNVIIQSKCGKIKIEPGYRNADRIALLIYWYFPDAFSTKAAKVGIPGVRTEGEVSIFWRKRVYGVIGMIMMVVGVGFLFAPDERIYVIVILYGIPGLLMFLSFAVARAYVDDEKIVFRNLVGYRKEIRWQDVRSVNSVFRRGLIIKSYTKRIKISWGFAGYELLCDIVSEKTEKTQNVQDAREHTT